MSEDEKLGSVGENLQDPDDIFKVLAKVKRDTLLETVLRRDISLGSVDPEHGRWFSLLLICLISLSPSPQFSGQSPSDGSHKR